MRPRVARRGLVRSARALAAAVLLALSSALALPATAQAQNVSEPPGEDLPDSTTTTGRVAVGGSVTGAIGQAKDIDAFAVEMVQGLNYGIDVEGVDTSQGTLADPELFGVYRVSTGGNFDRIGSHTRDLDSGDGRNAQIAFTLGTLASGTFYLLVTSQYDTTGTYRLSVRVLHPGKPTNLSATANGSMQIDLSWDAPADDGGSAITGYKIEVSTTGGIRWTVLVPDTGNDDTEYSHTGLSPGDTRTYRVSAINVHGTSEASDMGGAAMDSVVITLAMGPATVQSGAMQLTVGAPQLETLADTVPAASEHRGSYFGAAGTYMCNVGPCAIRRATGGSTPFGVDTSVLAPGTWWFRPDPGATITVPDQDWMVYGAWMTTPDVAAGTHRIGVLANGFDPYEGAAGVFAAGGLTGTATYSGGAAGVYVNDSTASGLFTANATLTANFDVNGNGAVDAAANDYTIAGRIDDFRGTDGNFLGTDTAANPNDPVTGGENDWVVLLSQVGLAGVIPTTPTAGSADGVTWAGNWSGQLYGPNVDAMGNAVSPSGVAGQFNAATANNATAVVGAFGATRD